MEEWERRAGNELNTAINKTVREANSFSDYNAKQFEQIGNEPNDDKTTVQYAAYAASRAKAHKGESAYHGENERDGGASKFERFIGGNLINAIGAFFIILGVIGISRPSFTYLTEGAKSVIMFITAAVFLFAGEALNRKKPDFFAFGLLATGIAGFYAATATSFFVLDVINASAAVLLVVLITACAFYFAIRYDSQVIAAFALIGGYLPLLALGDNISLIFGVMIYFAALNMLGLYFAFARKKWPVALYIGFILNLGGTIYIIGALSDYAWALPNLDGFMLVALSAVIYTFFSFGVYLAIPLTANYRAKKAFTVSDTVLFAMNNAFSAMILYTLLYEFDLSNYMGLLSLSFAIIYLLLGRVAKKRFAGERNIRGLFHVSALTFVILTAPMQYGVAWASLSWLILSVCLSIYGIMTDNYTFRRSGYIIGAFCLAAFVFYDIPNAGYVGVNEFDLFPFKYLSVTIGTVAVLAAFAAKKIKLTGAGVVFRCAVIINTWIYLMYLDEVFRNYLYRADTSDLNKRFLSDAFAISLTFFYALLLPSIRAIYDNYTRAISVLLTVFGMLMLLSFNTAQRYSSNPDASADIVIIAGCIIVLLSALSAFALYRVISYMTTDGRSPSVWPGFIMSVYCLFNLTYSFVMQYNLSFYSIVISITYVIASLAWIIHGFRRKSVFVRRFGLGLAITAMTKLFFIDLAFLSDSGRVISYFSFGIAFFAISYAYRHFTARLTAKTEE